ncbi:AEC family transporter [Oscillospiraceae bacterium MB08-C2-2]|nr:AEC family transporter [Oscillospiraceae bacterium MB08-C2-2]
MHIWLQAAIYLVTIALGYLLKKLGVFQKENRDVFANAVFYLTLPALIVSSFDQVQITLWFMVALGAGLFCNLFCLLMAAVFSRKKKPEIRGIYLINTPGYNVGNITIPFLQSFYPAGIPYLCMFDAGDSIFTLGTTYSIAKTLLNKKDLSIGRRLLDIFRSLLGSIPFVAYLAMTVLSIVGLSLPSPVIELAGFIGKANAPLVMLMLGISFELHINKEELVDILSILGLRVGCSVLLFAAIVWLLPGPPIMKQVLSVSVFSAIPNACLIYSNKFNAATSVASTLNPLSILLSILLMSLAMSLV